MRQVLSIEARPELWLTLGPGSATAVGMRQTLQQLLDRTLLRLQRDTMQKAAAPQPRLRSDGRVGDPWSASMALAAVEPQWSQALLHRIGLP